MAFDFPANPQYGDVFAPPNGPVYRYSGSTWMVAEYEDQVLAPSESYWPTRADLVTDVDQGMHVYPGKPYTAGGQQYVGIESGSQIIDLPHLAPLGQVTPFHFGGIGDGVADDTAAINAAIQYCYDQWYGGTVDMSGGRWLIDSGHVLLKGGVKLLGHWRHAGQWATVDPAHDLNWRLEKSCVILNPLYSIKVIEDCCAVEGLLIIRKDLPIYPDQSDPIVRARAAMDAVKLFSGTGVLIGVSGAFLAGSDCYVGYCLIAGFEYAIKSTDQNRGWFEYIAGDCINGIHVHRVTDTQHLSHCHFWPYTTSGGAEYTISGMANNGSGLIRVTIPANAIATGDIVNIKGATGTVEANNRWVATKIDDTHIDLQGSVFVNAWISGGAVSLDAGARNGISFWFDGKVGGAQMSDCFSHGYDVGYKVDDATSTVLVNCSCESGTYNNDKTTIGFHIFDVDNCTLIGCRAVAMGIGVQMEAGTVHDRPSLTLSGFNVKSSIDVGVWVKTGWVNIIGSSFWSLPVGIRVEPDAEGVHLTSNHSRGLVTTMLSISGAALRRSTIVNNSWDDALIGDRQLMPTAGVRSRYLTNFSTISTGPTQVSQKGRGSPDAPLPVAINDASLSLAGAFWDGVDTFRVGGTYKILAAEVTSPTKAGATHVFNVTELGALTTINAFTISAVSLKTAVDVIPSTSGTLSLGLNTARWANTVSNIFTMPNNVTNPTAITNHGQLYLDGVNLKFKFPSGTIKTIATDP